MSAGPLPSFCPADACDFIDPAGLGRAVGHRAATSVMTAFSDWVVDGASWLAAHVVDLADKSTDIRFDTVWFGAKEDLMLRIAALLIGPLLGAAVIGAILRQDGQRLVRVLFVGLPVAILGATLAVSLTQMAVEVVDGLCRLVVSQDSLKSFQRIGDAVASPGTPQFVQFIVAAVVVVAAVLLWLELVLRAAVVYLAVFFLPLGLAAYVWPTTAHITRRFVEIILSVIGSKFVIVATLTLGGALVTHGGGGIDTAVTGTAVLLLAAFAPFTVLKLVPLVESAATSHLEGVSRRPGQAAAAAGSTALGAGRRAASLLGGMGGGGNGGLPEAAEVGAVGIGDRAADWSSERAGGAPSSSGGGSPVDGSGGRGGSSVGTGTGGDGGGGPAGPAMGPVDGGGTGGLSEGSGGGAGGGGVGGGSLGGGSLGGGSSGGGSSGGGSGGDGSAGRGGASSPDTRTVAPEPRAPSVPDLPPVLPGTVGAERDGWADDV
jgi:hypothetical protein